MIDKVNDKNYLLTDIINKIENVEQKIDIIWESLITNEISSGMKLIAELFGNLDAIITKINNIKNIDITTFFQCMSQLESAMSVPDYMLIADLVKYEIKQIVILWKDNLDIEMKNLLN